MGNEDKNNNATTPPDFTGQEFPEPPDTIWLRHDGTFWHAVTTARLPDSPQYVRVQVNNDFYEQARQLVESVFVSGERLSGKEELVKRVTSFAAEAAMAALEQERIRIRDIITSIPLQKKTMNGYTSGVTTAELKVDLLAAIGDDRE